MRQQGGALRDLEARRRSLSNRTGAMQCDPGTTTYVWTKFMQAEQPRGPVGVHVIKICRSLL